MILRVMLPADPTPAVPTLGAGHVITANRFLNSNMTLWAIRHIACLKPFASILHVLLNLLARAAIMNRPRNCAFAAEFKLAMFTNRFSSFCFISTFCNL